MAKVAPSSTSMFSNGASDFPKSTMNGHAHVDNTDLPTSTLNTPMDSPSTQAPPGDTIQTITYKPPEKFHRIDTLHMKRKLFEALGSGESGESEQARQYWEYLGQFVRGKLRREEFVELLAGVLDTTLKITLHNHLLTAVLHNSVCTQPIASTPTLPTTQTVVQNTTTDPTDPNKPQDPNSSTDPNSTSSLTQPPQRPRQLDIAEVPDVLPRRTRVREWLGGLNRAERDRLKRLGGASMHDDRNKTFGEMQRGYQGRGRFRQHSKPLRNNVLSSLHPLAQSTGYAPSQRQLKERLVDLAKLNGMTEGVAEGMDDLVGAALDTHLDSLFCAAIDVKLRRHSLDERIPDEGMSAETIPADTTSDKMQVDTDEPTAKKPQLPLPTSAPPPHPSSPRAAGLAILKQDSTYQLAETDPIHLEIQDFDSLFTLAPSIHPHLGSAVWQLRNGVVLREEQLEEEAKSMEEMWKSVLMGEVEMDRSFGDVGGYHPYQQQGAGRSRVIGMNGNGNGNAEAGPGPSSSNRLGIAVGSTDPSRLKLGFQPRETPSLSRPPTPVTSHAVGLANKSSSSSSLLNGGVGVLRPLPGPGGIIPRPLGRGIPSSAGVGGSAGGNGRIIPSSSSSIGGGLGLAGLGYGTGTRREMIQRELEARKLYKVVDGRPMMMAGAAGAVIPPIPANQGMLGVGGPLLTGVAPGGVVPAGAGTGVGMTVTGPSTVLLDSKNQNEPGINGGGVSAPGPAGVPPTVMLGPAPMSTHGPNYWPYVDPASIFKDILG